MRWQLRIVSIIGCVFSGIVISSIGTDKILAWPVVIICLASMVVFAILFFKQKYPPGLMLAFVICLVVLGAMMNFPVTRKFGLTFMWILFMYAIMSVWILTEEKKRDPKYTYSTRVGTSTINRMVSLNKNCGACGRSVPLSSLAGQRCPYCGAYWSYEEQRRR